MSQLREAIEGLFGSSGSWWVGVLVFCLVLALVLFFLRRSVGGKATILLIFGALMVGALVYVPVRPGPGFGPLWDLRGQDVDVVKLALELIVLAVIAGVAVAFSRVKKS